MKKSVLILSFAALVASCSSGTEKAAPETQLTDAAPLHLLAPDYGHGYGVPSPDSIKAKIHDIYVFLASSTPTEVINRNTGETITDYAMIDSTSEIKRGAFRLTSYEWGVLYAAMLRAGEVTGDTAFTNYAVDRMKFLNALYPFTKELQAKGMLTDRQMRQFTKPEALDDGGAICAAMIKAQVADSTLDFSAMIDNYSDYVLNKEHRLADGTYARNRPHVNSVWLDDMFMGVPTVVQMAKYKPAEAAKYHKEAVDQIKGFEKRMWVPEKNLFRHGWVEEMTRQPSFFWGRANGWALLTLTEVLDVLPADHHDRPYVLDLFKKHVDGLLAVQGTDGMWHQMLDRPETYSETSATAIYTYCIAHAINEGWIDAVTYGSPVVLAWHALAPHISSAGKVDGTCVGTGMGFDPAYYACRPVNAQAAHGYGPSLWAAAEMLRLVETQNPKMNDSALQFYSHPIDTDEPIFTESGITVEF